MTLHPLAGKPAPAGSLIAASSSPRRTTSSRRWRVQYNPPHGGPAGSDVTKAIEIEANRLLVDRLAEVKRISHERALRASTTHRHDFLNSYVADLGSVLDMNVIRDAGLAVGVDPLGGAGVNYWGAIAERYGLNLTIINPHVDPTFRFMDVDWGRPHPHGSVVTGTRCTR